MTHHNGLPGFDAWLTTQPTGDEVEPSPQNLIDAAKLLSEQGDIPYQEEVYNLACMLANAEVEASRNEAEEHAAKSSREDSEDRFGDGPL